MFIENTILWNDERRPGTVQMCKNGKFLGNPGYRPENEYYCVDGKVWLVAPEDRCVLLGDYNEWKDEVRRGIRCIRVPN